MLDSPLLFCRKLLAFPESLKTSRYFKVIIEPIMLARINQQSLSASRLSLWTLRCVWESLACAYMCDRVRAVKPWESHEVKVWNIQEVWWHKRNFIKPSEIVWVIYLRFFFSERSWRLCFQKERFQTICGAKFWGPPGQSHSSTASNRKCWRELLSLVLICMRRNLFHLKRILNQGL